MSAPPDETAISDRITRWLRCPVSHEPLTVQGGEILCRASGFRGKVRDDVAVMLPEASESFFDGTFKAMVHGKGNKGEWDFCYARQTELLTRALKPGMVFLDIGCGPALPYAVPEGVTAIGLEPSFLSIRENRQLHLRVFGTAYTLPLATASVDAVACFYSVHHMVGEKSGDAVSNAGRAFAEIARVLKPGGTVFVFEMTPSALFAAAQDLGWDLAKRVLGAKLDMYFFPAERMEAIGLKAFPAGTVLEKASYEVSAFTTFAPVFSIPWFKVPRIIYPLGARLYKWRTPPL
jgi:SAM-dependent methyltransferase